MYPPRAERPCHIWLQMHIAPMAKFKISDGSATYYFLLFFTADRRR